MIIGMDIGYSNLKVCFGTGLDDYQTRVLPVGVKEKDDIGLYKPPENSVNVLVDGVEYIAGVPFGTGETRSLHDNYVLTDEYRALYYTTLAVSGADTVDCLVTGLPVKHFLDKRLKQDLMNMLVGEHRINEYQTVSVKTVRIVPQPIGGFLNTVEADHLEYLADQDVLIIDPGFFSVDWTLINRSSVVSDAMGSSMMAVSVLFENVSKELNAEYGCNISIDEIESRVRASQDYTYAYSKKVELKPYLDRAMKKVGAQLSKEIESSMRRAGKTFNSILLIGGGAKLYQKMVRDTFPENIDIIVPDEHLLSNVLGYYIVCIDG